MFFFSNTKWSNSALSGALLLYMHCNS